jgi:hypothetical protein
MPFEKSSLLTTSDVDRGAMVEEQEFGQAPSAVPVKVEHSDALFSANEAQEFRSRWQGVQTAFVDEPRRAVEDADKLVATAVQRLSEMFSEERSKLEAQWGRGNDVSTEDLRVALQRYRACFTRLHSV